MKEYKLEVRATMICFIVAAIIGGFLSSFFVIFNSLFFNQVAPPEHLAEHFTTMYVAKTTVLGFPLHYFLLITLSWLGTTLIGAIWCLIMDRLEKIQQQ
jgi:hypothetical protein